MDFDCNYATWCNVAICYKYDKTGIGKFYWFSNGKKLAEKDAKVKAEHPYNYLDPSLTKTPHITIGGCYQTTSASYNFPGYIAELRISDVCRYIEDYSVEDIGKINTNVENMTIIYPISNHKRKTKRIVIDDEEQRNRYIRCYEYR